MNDGRLHLHREGSRGRGLQALATLVGVTGAAGDSEQAVRAGLRHELELVGLALEVAVLDPGPAAAVVAGGAEAVGKGLGGLDVEEAVRRHVSMVPHSTIKDKATLLQSN
jgi:hypothetical protein